MAFEVLDPTFGESTESLIRAPRLASPEGAIIGIVSNGKQGTGRFFDALADHLKSRHGVAEVVRVTKSNYSAPAGDDIIDQARRWTALVAGVGD